MNFASLCCFSQEFGGSCKTSHWNCQAECTEEFVVHSHPERLDTHLACQERDFQRILQQYGFHNCHPP